MQNVKAKPTLSLSLSLSLSLFLSFSVSGYFNSPLRRASRCNDHPHAKVTSSFVVAHDTQAPANQHQSRECLAMLRYIGCGMCQSSSDVLVAHVYQSTHIRLSNEALHTHQHICTRKMRTLAKFRHTALYRRESRQSRNPRVASRVTTTRGAERDGGAGQSHIERREKLARARRRHADGSLHLCEKASPFGPLCLPCQRSPFGFASFSSFSRAHFARMNGATR